MKPSCISPLWTFHNLLSVMTQMQHKILSNLNLLICFKMAFFSLDSSSKNSYRIRIKVRWCIDSSLQKIFWKFIQHTHLQTLVHFLRLPHTPMHTCAYPTHPHTQAHTHSHLHTPMYMYAQPHPPTYMYIYLHTPVHTCAHLCTPVHTCAHQRTPTHTRKYHTHTRWCP